MVQHSTLNHTGLTGVSTLSFGSNSNSVAIANAPGASSSNTRADHVHLGVTSLAHTSNTFSGPVILTAGTNVGITVPATGTYRIDVNAAGGGGGSGNYSSVLWSSGTSMPGSPVTNQRITRTDLGLDFSWDGTRWVSVTLFTVSFPPTTAFATFTVAANAGRLPIPYGGVYTLWVVSMDWFLAISNAHSATLYWTCKLNWANASDTDTQLGATMDSKLDTTANNNYNHRIDIGAALPSTARELKMRIDPNGGVDGLSYTTALLSYRLVGT